MFQFSHLRKSKIRFTGPKKSPENDASLSCTRLYVIDFERLYDAGYVKLDVWLKPTISISVVNVV